MSKNINLSCAIGSELKSSTSILEKSRHFIEHRLGCIIETIDSENSLSAATEVINSLTDIVYLALRIKPSQQSSDHGKDSMLGGFVGLISHGILAITGDVKDYTNLLISEKKHSISLVNALENAKLMLRHNVRSICLSIVKSLSENKNLREWIFSEPKSFTL